MNFRKHLAGFAIFSVILGCAILINHFLTAAKVIIQTTPTYDPVAVPAKREAGPQFFNYKVRLVSLDFINQRSYTVLSLKRDDGQPAPEKLWVTTVFSPDSPYGKILVSTTEIPKPFANGDYLEYTATGSFNWRDYPYDQEYFARVYVSTNPTNLYPQDSEDGTKISVPVVVQWPKRPQSSLRVQVSSPFFIQDAVRVAA